MSESCGCRGSGRSVRLRCGVSGRGTESFIERQFKSAAPSPLEGVRLTSRMERSPRTSCSFSFEAVKILDPLGVYLEGENFQGRVDLRSRMLSSLGLILLLSEIFQEKLTFLEEIQLMDYQQESNALILMRQQQSRGRRNWLKLSNIIRSGTLAAHQSARRFHLFDRRSNYLPDHLLTSYSLGATTLLTKSPLPIYKHLLHFQGPIDTTGRWVWEAEEVAAYFFLRRGEVIAAEVLSRAGENNRQLRVLELGAGSSGLAGLALSQVAVRLKGIEAKLELTDGEEENIAFLQQNLLLNNIPAGSSARKLLWGESGIIENLNRPEVQRSTYQVIIMCDCLYFVAFHKQLLMTIDSLLSGTGFVFAINPTRGDSMKIFMQLAQASGFCCEILTFEDEKYQTQAKRAKTDSGFEEDKHFLFFIRISRKTL